MENAGKSVADGLGIALHLVDMLPTIPLQLAFNTATARLSGCTPEVYAVLPQVGTDGLDLSYAPPPGRSRDEILKSTRGTEEKAMPPTWLLTAASGGSVRVKTVESEGGDYPNHPHAFPSPAGHASCSPALRTFPSAGQHAAGYLVPHSPSYSPPHSPSPDFWYQGFRSTPSSSNSSASDPGSSSLSKSSLDTRVWYRVSRQWFQQLGAIPLRIP